MGKIFFFINVFFFVALSTGCSSSMAEPIATTAITEPTANAVIMEATPDTASDETSNEIADVNSDVNIDASVSEEDEINEILGRMTPEEKIGQLFMTRIRDATPEDITRYHLGGVVLFAKDILSREQVQELCLDIQAGSKNGLPLFIGIDEEGGRVSRITSITGVSRPSAYSINQDSEAVYAEAYETGLLLAELGVNVNFAPVADVWTNPANTVIGDRSYSDDPHTAAEMVAAAVNGYQDAGIISVIKHFPGHGDTYEDSHNVTAVYTQSEERLREIELIPFISGIKAGAIGVMAGHIAAPAITGDDMPATFQRYLLQDILRDELGFYGLIFTDAMDMGGVTRLYPSDEAALKAVIAGVDIVLIPEDMDLAYNGLLTAYYDGTLAEERLDESVGRILNSKLTISAR